MKKLLSILICAIMVFSLLPLTAFAAASISEVDFSTRVEEGETVTREITELDPLLEDISLDVGSWSGYAKGYTVYLEAEHYYEFTATVRSEYGYYFDRAIAIYPETIESEDDWIDLEYGWSDDGVKSYTVSCNFFPYTSGYYKILTWGYALDEDDDYMFDLLYEDLSFEEIDAYDVDYSEVIELDKTVTGTVNETDLFIGYNGWRGYAKGFTANLEAGQVYSFGIELTNNSGVDLFADRAIAVFDSEGNEVYYSEDGTYVNSETSESFFFSFFLPESGEYRILTWGYTTDDSDGTDVFGEDNITVAYTLSEAKPTEVVISTPDDLWDISFDFYNDVYDGKYVSIILANDIDMSEKYDFQAIDAHGVAIVEFEGKDHSITGLSDTLFYGADSLSVKDLTLEAELVIANEEYVENIGILVNYAEYLKLDNVFVDGLIDIEDCEDVEDLGGIVGEVGQLIAVDSYSSVDICFLNTPDVWYVGGFAGYVWGDSSINDCGWSGTINIDDAALYAVDIGGFIGYSEDPGFIYIEDCTAIGYITFEEPIDPDAVNFDTIGGFIGVNYADLYINNCYADVDITAPETYYVGGIIGRIEHNVNIMNTYSDGIIVGGYYVGGFIGISYDDDTIANCYSVADVSGLNYIGGFIGGAAQDQMFINCYAAGSVERLNDEYADAGTGMFLGVCEDECGFANVFCASDDNYGPCGDYASYMDNITVVDFGNETEVASMEDMLNNYVDSSNEQELFYDSLNNWEGRNDKNAPTFAEEPQYLLGDANCDGAINQYDYILVKRHYFGTRYLTETEMLAADVNEDGTVNQYDYILIKRHYFGTYVIGG
ncbi:MAG: hypothetical protein E7595_02115 [Ruminococcaceae bacterium]|nr:hypothetical protein [Oscillospiraceae bacterium]